MLRAGQANAGAGPELAKDVLEGVRCSRFGARRAEGPLPSSSGGAGEGGKRASIISIMWTGEARHRQQPHCAQHPKRPITDFLF